VIARLGLALAMASTPAMAQDAGAFFRGKQISLVVGYNSGGSYDLYASLAANALPRFIPGNPTIIVKHMPGVGGLKAANYLAQQGSRDGLTLGVVSQAAALRQVIGEAGVEYDARRLNWIGRLAPSVEVTLVWRTSPVRTLADAALHETVLAATSAGSTTDFLPRLMNEFAGTKFKIVKGYPGTSGASLAMERGEVDGAHETIDTLLFSRPEWLRDKTVSVLVQYAQRRHPALPDVPAMVEVGANDEQRQILNLFGSTADVGRALVAPPDLPADRLETLRRGFDAMVADPGFRAEVAKRNLDLLPLSGEALQALIIGAMNVPPEVVAKAKTAIAN
jgi:tripartite-type tricarboxylate transporter receptor subunit TctC